MPKRRTNIERPMLMSVAADPPSPAEVAQPAPAEVARPTPAEWAPRNEEECVHFFLYLLKAPIVGHPDWVDTPMDQHDKVTLERMVHHNEVFAQKMCTQYEAMLYISSATLVHPPSHDWYVIYMWLFRRWNADAAKACEIDPPEKLNVNQQEDLDRLRQWVFKQQMLHLKKGKGAALETVEKERKQLEVERPRLF